MQRSVHNCGVIGPKSGEQLHFTIVQQGGECYVKVIARNAEDVRIPVQMGPQDFKKLMDSVAKMNTILESLQTNHKFV
jgi:hypothetical protein